MKRIPIARCVAAVCLVFASTSYGGTYTVSGRANVFGAGHAPPGDDPCPSGGGGGVPPVAITFPAAPNNDFIFTNVVGKVSFRGRELFNGPDGGAVAYSVTSWGGIAGIKAESLGYLAGVFLDSAEPADPAPSALDFGLIGTNFVSLSPQIGQVFFIGDGLTENGVVQRFHAPPSATRLFLGLSDSAHSGGTPGFYYDNLGWFTVSVERLHQVSDGDGASTGVTSQVTTSAVSVVYKPVFQTNVLSRDSAFGYSLPPDLASGVVIETSSDLIHWSPATNIDLFFKDLDSTNHSSRFYRFLKPGGQTQ